MRTLADARKKVRLTAARYGDCFSKTRVDVRGTRVPRPPVRVRGAPLDGAGCPPRGDLRQPSRKTASLTREPRAATFLPLWLGDESRVSVRSWESVFDSGQAFTLLTKVRQHSCNGSWGTTVKFGVARQGDDADARNLGRVVTVLIVWRLAVPRRRYLRLSTRRTRWLSSVRAANDPGTDARHCGRVPPPRVFRSTCQRVMRWQRLASIRSSV